MDLLKAVRRLKAALRTPIEVYHIYAHQDDNTAYALLPRDVQLNVEVDSIAQDSLDQAYSAQTLHHNSVYPKEGWTIWIQNIKLTVPTAYTPPSWTSKYPGVSLSTWGNCMDNI